jgi:hypothetical protein
VNFFVIVYAAFSIVMNLESEFQLNSVI